MRSRSCHDLLAQRRLVGMLGLLPTATMPLAHDKYDVNSDLVTMAGAEYTMQANLTHYEDILELEDDILSFLPMVSTIDVFGCEVELIELDTQLPLSEAFHTVLLQQKKLQIVVRPCMVEGHSIWQFQAEDRKSYPKAVRVPLNSRREIADRAFYGAPMLRHVEIAAGIQDVGFAAWQGCQQLQIVKLPPSVLSLEDGAFQGCYVLREIVAQVVSNTVEECSRSVPPSVKWASTKRQKTTVSLHPWHSWAAVRLRAA